MDSKDKIAAVGLGALGGGVAAFVIWQVMKDQVDRQVAATIDTQVAATIDSKLNDVGLSPTMITSLRTILNSLDQSGILNTLATATATLPAANTGVHGLRGRGWR